MKNYNYCKVTLKKEELNDTTFDLSESSYENEQNGSDNSYNSLDKKTEQNLDAKKKKVLFNILEKDNINNNKKNDAYKRTKTKITSKKFRCFRKKKK